MRTTLHVKYNYGAGAGAEWAPVFEPALLGRLANYVGYDRAREALVLLRTGASEFAIPAKGVDVVQLLRGAGVPCPETVVEARRLVNTGTYLSLFGQSLERDNAEVEAFRLRPAPNPAWRDGMFFIPLDTDGYTIDDDEATDRLKDVVLRVYLDPSKTDLPPDDFTAYTRIFTKKDDGQLVPFVRFVKSEKDGQLHRTTELTLTRFLSRFCDFEKHALGTVGPKPEDRAELKAWRAVAEAEREKMLAYVRESVVSTGELVISSNEQDIVRAYVDGPSSCMSGDKFSPDKHPVRVYAHESGDIAIAYWRRRGRITARALINTRTQVFSRVYGDETTLVQELHKAGYCGPEDNALDGCRIRKIWKRGRTKLVGPYIDARCRSAAGACVDDCGDHLEIGGEYDEDDTESYGDYVADLTSGELRSIERDLEDCANCGDRYHVEDLVPTADGLVCETCNEDYVICDVTDERVHRDQTHEVQRYVEGRSHPPFYCDANVCDRFIFNDDTTCMIGLSRAPRNRYVRVTVGEYEDLYLQRTRVVRDERGEWWERDDLLNEGGEITDENGGFAVGRSPEAVDADEPAPTPRCPDTPDMLERVGA